MPSIKQLTAAVQSQPMKKKKKKSGKVSWHQKQQKNWVWWNPWVLPPLQNWGLDFYLAKRPHRPLNPSMMFSAEPAMKAPCVALIAWRNLCSSTQGEGRNYYLLCRQEYDLTAYLLDSSGTLKAVHFFLGSLESCSGWRCWALMEMMREKEREREREREMGSGVCLPHVSQECQWLKEHWQ